MTGNALTRQELLRYRRELEALANRLSGTAARLEAEATRPTGAEGTAAFSPNSKPTSTSTEGDEEVAHTALLSEGQLLTEARAALVRIGAGTFGRCERCGRAIGRSQLNAVPYGRHCIGCAQHEVAGNG